MRKLFVDMDGVLADFDTHYKNVFGVEASKVLDNVDWKAVRAVPHFYRDIPPMSGFYQLWDYVRHLNPTILSGVPHSVSTAAQNKLEWIHKNIGTSVSSIFCKSKDKSYHLTPGDILIDDWEKYKDLWIRKGGIWITHINASDTIIELSHYWFQ